MTCNFIAYNADGKVMLYPVKEGTFVPYDPKVLCNVKAGKAYTVTYDAQMIKGGVAGRDDRFFLTVCSFISFEYFSFLLAIVISFLDAYGIINDYTFFAAVQFPE